jgi:hypothetical protein
MREKTKGQEVREEEQVKKMFKRLTPIVLALCVSGAFSAAAQAETTGPVWKILSVDTPTNFKPGDKSGDDAIVVTAVNVGGVATGCTAAVIETETRREEKEAAEGIPRTFIKQGSCHGSVGKVEAPSASVAPVTIADSLPKGLTAVEVFGVNAYHQALGFLEEVGGQEISSEQLGPPYGLSCTFSSTAPSCATSERIDPGDTLVITIRVSVATEIEGSGEASVSGGGAARASVGNLVTISSVPAAYGLATGSLLGATSTSQAGGHPNVTNEFFLNTINPVGELDAQAGSTSAHPLLASEPQALPKDVRFDLPPGLVGTTVGVPRCSMADVINQANCPQNTMVGTATLIVWGKNPGRLVITVPVYNIAPAPGEPAAFAFNALFFPVRLDTSVLSDGEYNVRVTTQDITSGAKDYMSSVTIWGDPAEHNAPGPDVAARNLGAKSCPAGGIEGCHPEITFGGSGVEEYPSAVEPNGHETSVLEQRVPLLTNPSQCSTPLTGVLETDSWDAEGVFGGPDTATIPMGTATGCAQLSFKPSVSMLPDTLEAGVPAGYSFDLSLPQDTEAEGLATADV